MNVMGRSSCLRLDDPFQAVTRELPACALRQRVRCAVIDFHAEASSEKQAMGYFVDGKVSLVVGTHTHVPTADRRVLSGGTAYMTDVGMCGDYDSMIGMEKDEPLRRSTTKIACGRLEPARGKARSRARGRDRRPNRPCAPQRRRSASARCSAGGAGSRNDASASAARRATRPLLLRRD